MKKIIGLIVFLALSINIGLIFAASGETSGTTSLKADHFVVTTDPTSIKVGEAIDLTVEAVDKNGEMVKDYLGTIYITVENDTKATVPYVDGYQFVVADLGKKIFSKGLSFTKEGKMKVTVLDIDNDTLEGFAYVTVSSTQATTKSGSVSISSPDNGVTISDNKVMVSGTTKKNSKIQLVLNSKNVGETQSDISGSFSYEITGLVGQTNTISVNVLDGEDNVIAESEQIIVNLESSGPAFKGINIKEGNEVPSSSKINLEVLSEPSLLEATVSINNINETLKESSTPGSYVGIITVPSKSGTYPIAVNLKNALGKTTTKDDATSIKVTEANIFKNIKTVTGDKKVTFTFEVSPDTSDIIKFKFKYGTGNNLLDKEVITLDKNKIISASGGYSWYVGNLDISKYYFQIYALDQNQKELPGKSDIIDIDLSLASASTCMISNIANFIATKKGNITTLSWDALPEATSYNVYKKDASGNFSLIENIKSNTYDVNISGDKIKFEEFFVKGVCGNNENESADFSNATKVQTGPIQIMALIVISLTISLIYLFARRKRI